MSDFGRVISYLKGFEPRMMREIEKATAKNAALAERTAVMHLRNQDLGWKPLSAEYLNRKQLTGAGKRSYIRGTWRGKTAAKRTGKRLSEKTLIATSTMLKAITSKVYSPTEAAAGVLRSADYKDGGSVVNIAEVHEFGTKDGRIPKRPLWEPTRNEIDAKCKDNWIKAMDRVIRHG